MRKADKRRRKWERHTKTDKVNNSFSIAIESWAVREEKNFDSLDTLCVLCSKSSELCETQSQLRLLSPIHQQQQQQSFTNEKNERSTSIRLHRFIGHRFSRTRLLSYVVLFIYDKYLTLQKNEQREEI